MAKLYLLTD